jgi:hypothetical protein
LQSERRDDFSDEKPVAETAIDQVGVLADESQASTLRNVPLQERAGVDIP